MTNHELIILALEQLRDGSYSPERKERCQGLIEEMRGDEKQGDLLLRLPVESNG